MSNRKMPQMPAPLIRFGLKCLKHVEKHGDRLNFCVNVDRLHAVLHVHGDLCQVNLIGVVVAHLNDYKMETIYGDKELREKFPKHYHRIQALDSFYWGNVTLGLIEMGVFVEGLDWSDMPSFVHAMPKYREKPRAFKIAMKKLAKYLESKPLYKTNREGEHEQ